MMSRVTFSRTSQPSFLPASLLSGGGGGALGGNGFRSSTVGGLVRPAVMFRTAWFSLSLAPVFSIRCTPLVLMARYFVSFFAWLGAGGGAGGGGGFCVLWGGGLVMPRCSVSRPGPVWAGMGLGFSMPIGFVPR